MSRTALSTLLVLLLASPARADAPPPGRVDSYARRRLDVSYPAQQVDLGGISLRDVQLRTALDSLVVTGDGDALEVRGSVIVTLNGPSAPMSLAGQLDLGWLGAMQLDCTGWVSAMELPLHARADFSGSGDPTVSLHAPDLGALPLAAHTRLSCGQGRAAAAMSSAAVHAAAAAAHAWLGGQQAAVEQQIAQELARLR